MNPPVMGRPVELPSPWREMVEHAGTADRLIEALGVGKSTFYRWTRGELVPRKPTRDAVNSWAKRRGLKPPFGD